MDTVTATPAIEPLLNRATRIEPYANERTLYRLLAALSVLALAGLTLLTAGLVWIVIGWLFLGYLCLASWFIGHVRGNGVRITAGQYPQLYQRLLNCCVVAGLDQPPEFYLLGGNGMRNAFAARFLNRYYVVLMSDIVDALEDDQEALNFYIGHELGHIERGHLSRAWFLQLAMMLPLVGCAYARAREYTCDQYGLACCASVDSAVRALSVLAAGAQRWKTLDAHEYASQAAATGGFWMSLNELLSDYPWLCKRVARIRGDKPSAPARHPFACALACLVPRTGLGVIGGFVVYSYLVLIVAVVVASLAAGWPGPQASSSPDVHGQARDYATVEAAHEAAMDAIARTEAFVKRHRRWPASLAETGYTFEPSFAVAAIEIPAGSHGAIAVRFKEPYAGYSIEYARMADLGADDGNWVCGTSGIPDHAVPADCQASAIDSSEVAVRVHEAAPAHISK